MPGASGRVFGALLRSRAGAGIATAVVRAAHASVLALDALARRGSARPPNAAELRLLRTLFGDALDCTGILVRSGGLKSTVGLRAHAVCDEIWLSSDCLQGADALSARGRHVLLHEAVHLWQFQHHGPGYIAAALAAQLVHGTRGVGSGEAYDWLAAARSGTPFHRMNPEAQAELGAWVAAALDPDGAPDRRALNELLRRRAGEAALDDAAFGIVQAAREALRTTRCARRRSAT